MKILNWIGDEFFDALDDQPYTDPDFLIWAASYYGVKDGNVVLCDGGDESTLWSAWDAWKYLKKLTCHTE